MYRHTATDTPALKFSGRGGEARVRGAGVSAVAG